MTSRRKCQCFRPLIRRALLSVVEINHNEPDVSVRTHIKNKIRLQVYLDSTRYYDPDILNTFDEDTTGQHVGEAQGFGADRCPITNFLSSTRKCKPIHGSHRIQW